MKRSIVILAVLLLVSACTANGQFSHSVTASGECEGTKGATTATVHYGDSEIRVTPYSQININSEFRLKLVPGRGAKNGIDYENVPVTIRATSPSTPAWFNKTATYEKAPNHMIIFCVDADETEGTVYKFLVTVPGTGEIDPRAEVINQ